MKGSTLACAALVLLAIPAAARGQDAQWQIGTAPSFSSGRYGTGARTEVFHTPTTARRMFPDGDLTFVFPFTCIRGNGAVTIVGGTPLRKEPAGDATDSAALAPTRAGAATTGRDGTITDTARTAGDATLRPGTGVLDEVVTHCGMGDIVVRGRYYVLDERAWLPTIALRAHLKAPTADADSGLGTGRVDEGVGVEISRTFARATTIMVDGGYTVIGKPAGVSFNNSWWYDVGVGQDLANGVVNLSVFFEEYRAIVPGLENARDVLAAITLRGAGGWRLQVS